MTLKERIIIEETTATLRNELASSWLWANGDAELVEGFAIGGARFKVVLKRKDVTASLKLYRVDGNPMPVHLRYNAVGAGNDTETTWLLFYPKWLGLQGSDEDYTVGEEGFGWENWITLSELSSSTQGTDVFTIIIMVASIRPYSLHPSDLTCCLRVDTLQHAFEGFEPSMITLKSVDNVELQLPKALLCFHSPVMKAAFRSSMVEATHCTIYMKDIEEETLKDFAVCVYQQGLPNSLITGWERLVRLLIMAQKYNITALATAITTILSAGISRDNAASLFKYSEKYNLLGLRRSLINFVTFDSKNLEAVTATDEYCSFSSNLLRDILAHRRKKMRKDCSYGKFPLMLQWGHIGYEFKDGCDWENLHPDSLRRACCERNLATTGAAADLIQRISSKGTRGISGDIDSEEEGAKRQRLV